MKFYKSQFNWRYLMYLDAIAVVVQDKSTLFSTFGFHDNKPLIIFKLLLRLRN